MDKVKQKKLGELYALYCLQAILPGRYLNLTYIGGNESPDLQDPDNGIGVEVTTSNRDQKFLFYYDTFVDKPYSSVPTNVLREMKNAGYFFGCDKGCIVSMHGPHAFDMSSPDDFSRDAASNLDSSIRKKLGLLNGTQYTKFKSNELFIRVDNMLNTVDMNKVIEDMAVLSANYNIAFSRLYICRTWDIFCIDYEHDHMDCFDIGSLHSTLFNRAFDDAGLVYPEVT